MSEKRKISEPNLPGIQQCPRCGANILLGDSVCNQCGYNIQTTSQRLKSQPPIIVAGFLFGLGIFIALAATGMQNPWQFIAFLLGMGFIISGGVYYAADLLILNADDKRKE